MKSAKSAKTETTKRTAAKSTYNATNDILRIVITTALILALPAIAMQFTDEITWDEADFGVAGAMLLSGALLFQMILMRTRSRRLRILAGTVLVAVLTAAWAHLAIGVFD